MVGDGKFKSQRQLEVGIGYIVSGSRKREGSCGFWRRSEELFIDL